MNDLKEIWEEMRHEFDDSPAWIATAIIVFTVAAFGMFSLLVILAYGVFYVLFTQPVVTISVGILVLAWIAIYYVAKHKLN